MEFTCQHCNTTFVKPPSKAGRTRYCSNKCKYAARVTPRQITTCKWCAGPVQQTRTDRRQVFCSLVCRNRYTAKHRRTTKGSYITSKGYVAIYMPEHPDSTKGGYVMEHRMVMERVLGRRLKPYEVVHHKNGVRTDNIEANLEVLLKVDHDRLPKLRTGEIACPHCQAQIILSRPARIVKQTSRA